MLIFELFFKYKQLDKPRTWARAVEAYNGSGKPAADYRDEVMNRLRKARKHGDNYVPHHDGE